MDKLPTRVGFIHILGSCAIVLTIVHWHFIVYVYIWLAHSSLLCVMMACFQNIFLVPKIFVHSGFGKLAIVGICALVPLHYKYSSYYAQLNIIQVIPSFVSNNTLIYIRPSRSLHKNK